MVLGEVTTRHAELSGFSNRGENKDDASTETDGVEKRVEPLRKGPGEILLSLLVFPLLESVPTIGAEERSGGRVDCDVLCV